MTVGDPERVDGDGPRPDLDEIFSTRSGAGEKRAVEGLVRQWCSDHGYTSAALYAPGGERLIAAVGDGDIPERVAEGALALPGGGYLVTPAEPAAMNVEQADLALLGAAAAICHMKTKLREQNLQAMSQGVELVALYEVGLAIASILDLEELAEEVLSRALMLTESSLGALYTLDGDSYRLACARGEALEGFAACDLDLAELKKEGGVPAMPILRGAEATLALSIEAEGRPRGLLAVGRPFGAGGKLTAKDRSTLSLFANQAAIAMEQARLHRTEIEKQRMEREMEVAAEIQQEILPDAMPEIPGFEIAGWNRPARHVGGDYYGFKRLADDRWAVVLGDVSGKGAGAALLVSTLDSALRVLLDQMGVGVELAGRLNDHVWESSAANKFITLIAAELDPASGVLDFVNAGHNDGLLMHADGSVEHLEAAGSPIGMLPQSAFRAQSVNLAPGDLVCFYSDGITECEAPDEEEFEMERLTEVLRRNQARSLDEVLSAIEAAVTDYRAGLPQGDDQTVILLRREGSRGA